LKKLKKLIKEEFKSENALTVYNKLIDPKFIRGYHLIFERINGITKLTQEAIDYKNYLDSLK
jgi:hypothetical protein